MDAENSRTTLFAIKFAG